MADRPQDRDLDEILEAEPVTDPSEDSVGASIDQDSPTAGGDGVDGLPQGTDADTDEAQCRCRWCREAFETVSAERLHDCEGRRAAKWEVGREAPTIQPQTDEIKGYLLFAGAGLSPYFGLTGDAADRMIQNDVRFEFQGDEWSVDHINIRDGGIDGRETDVFETFNEGEIELVQDDDTDKRHLTLQFAPRFPGMESDGRPVESVPDDIPEGLNFHIHAAMLAPDEVLGVIQAWADAVDLNPTYFLEDAMSLEHCHVYQLERYTRARRERTPGKVVGDDGILDRLQRFSKQNGSTGESRWDNTEIVGGNNATVLAGDDWAKLLPGQSRPKRVKHYHPKYVRNESVDRGDDPLTDPKIGVHHGTKDSEAVRWDRLDGLIRELDDALLNVLHWSGLSISPTPEVYTADEYFSVSEYDRDPRIVEDPTPTLEVVEQDLAMRSALSADLTPSERDVLEALTDGGDGVHYEQLADRADTGSSTVYRFFEKMETVLSRANGRFSFADGVVREKFEELMQMLHDAADYADRSLRRLAEEERDYTLEDSPFAKWMRRYGVGMDRDRGEISLAVQTGRHSLDEVRRILRAGLESALQTSTAFAYDLVAGATVTYTTTVGKQREINPYQYYGESIKVVGRYDVDAQV